MNPQYFPAVFDVPDMQRAKEIILTEEGPGADTETRWRQETPYVLELIWEAFNLRPEMIVLDYGCGIGRLARAMIEASGCSVIGVDTSSSMRALSQEYVNSERFTAVSPDQFDLLVRGGLRVDAAISVWVLQHCFAPALDIERMRRGLVAGGRVFVLNMPKRAVPAVFDDPQSGTQADKEADKPTDKPAERKFAWAEDGVDVAALLRQAFEVIGESVLDRSRTPNMADVGAYWMSLRHTAV